MSRINGNLIIDFFGRFVNGLPGLVAVALVAGCYVSAIAQYGQVV